MNNKYPLGNILFCPADNETVADKIINGMNNLHSIIFCLEDSILYENLEISERKLDYTLQRISCSGCTNLPYIFIRIRDCNHMIAIAKKYQKYNDIITGFVLPKFDSSNASHYETAVTVLKHIGNYVYLPILETSVILDVRTRAIELDIISNTLDRITDKVCGIMIGGNDLSNHIGIRRNVNTSIYDCAAISNCIGDIVSVFSSKYMIIGPVYEYYSGHGWRKGFLKELALDLANGCDGKACIHPNQLGIVANSLKVSLADYEDSDRLLNWDNKSGVKGSNGRMLELTTNYNWAKKICYRKNIYGIVG